MYRPGPLHYPSPTAGRLMFSALARSEEVDNVEMDGEGRVVKGFLGMSEDGFVHSGQVSSICTVPGSTASWDMPS